MTLFSAFYDRIHFGEGILEEALQSELERNGLCRPVLLHDSTAASSDILDRVTLGLPLGVTKTQHFLDYKLPDFRGLRAAHDQIDAHGADVVIAFGSANAISAMRTLLHGQTREAGPIGVAPLMNEPKFFAVPGVDGLVSPAVLFGDRDPTRSMRRTDNPSVVICDPTLTMGQSAELTASASVVALVRCVEAILSDTYHPPADGLAFDGLKRIVGGLGSVLQADCLEGRRELMAAELNASLAMHKGVGITQLLIAELMRLNETGHDPGALMRLVFPIYVDTGRCIGQTQKDQQICDALNARPGATLGTALVEMMTSLPLPSSFQALGIAPDTLQKAATNITATSDMAAVETERFFASLQDAVTRE